jgi:small subunit ribosomal protein S7e
VYAPQFDPEDPSGKTLIIPVFLLYPQHATSDIIPQFVEDTPFSEHLARMFPPEANRPEWDKNGEYNCGALVIYAATHRKRLFKVGKKMTLRDVCMASKEKAGEAKDGLELLDGRVCLFVVPKGDVETNWVAEFKRTRGDRDAKRMNRNA